MWPRKAAQGDLHPRRGFRLLVAEIRCMSQRVGTLFVSNKNSQVLSTIIKNETNPGELGRGDGLPETQRRNAGRWTSGASTADRGCLAVVGRVPLVPNE